MAASLSEGSECCSWWCDGVKPESEREKIEKSVEKSCFSTKIQLKTDEKDNNYRNILKLSVDFVKEMKFEWTQTNEVEKKTFFISIYSELNFTITHTTVA